LYVDTKWGISNKFYNVIVVHLLKEINMKQFHIQGSIFFFFKPKLIEFLKIKFKVNGFKVVILLIVFVQLVSTTFGLTIWLWKYQYN